MLKFLKLVACFAMLMTAGTLMALSYILLMPDGRTWHPSQWLQLLLLGWTMVSSVVASSFVCVWIVK